MYTITVCETEVEASLMVCGLVSFVTGLGGEMKLENRREVIEAGCVLRK